MMDSAGRDAYDSGMAGRKDGEMEMRKKEERIGVVHPIAKEYHSYQRKKWLLLMAMAMGVLGISYVSLRSGIAEMDWTAMLQAFQGKGSETLQVVVWNIRLPRITAAVFAGAGLGMAGCIMQNNLRNPLASPSTLGITSASAFGANFAIIVLGGGSMQSAQADAVFIASPYVVALSAFLASLAALFLVMSLSKLRSFAPNVIILAGVAISALFGAATAFLQYFADSHHVAAAVFWTFGNLGRASWSELSLMGALFLGAFAYFLWRSWDYNAMISGDEHAVSLGVDTQKIRMGGMFFSSLLVSTAVSFLGIIGFVGLIAPQITRRIIGNDHRFLIPASALMGSLILLVSDTAARSLFSPVVLPVGVITSFLGAPVFLFILLRDYRRE